MECVFCKIVAGELSAYKIYEDKKFLGFLDANPLREGQTVVVSKTHWPSYVFDMPEEEMEELFAAARKVAKMLDRAMGTVRTVLVMEGLGVDHAHLKLYPVRNVEVEGSVVEMGVRAAADELARVAEKIIAGRGDDF